MKATVQICRARVWRGCLAVLAAGVLAAPSARATVLASYNFDATNLVASSVSSVVTASDFFHVGNGTAAFDQGFPATGKGYSYTIWTNTYLGSHFGFTVVLAPGYVAHLDSLAFDCRRSATGPEQWVVHYSLDGTTFYTLGSGDVGAAENYHSQLVADARPLDVTGTVYLRLYATNAVDGIGTWRLDNVTLNGTLRIDDGRRLIRSRASDGAHSDRWGASTNAGIGTVAVSTLKHSSGAWSLGLTGSDTGSADPHVVFDNVPLTSVLTNVLGSVEPVQLSVAFAADNPDTGDDLYLDLSYDNGASWNGSGSVKLVDGFGGIDVEFGATNGSNPTTVSPNPYLVTLGMAQTQIAVRVRFDESVGNSNSNDRYYVDDVQLSAVPVPAVSAPSVGNYGSASNVTTTGARLATHVRGGYPYPSLTLYYGPADGGTNAAAWSSYRALDAKRWGVVSAALTGLTPGQLYYYRAYARNTQGEAWSVATSNFTTIASAPSASGALYLDSFGIATAMPLSIDRDGNGLSDRWESEYLGGLGNTLSGDADNDGVSNGREMTAGTAPNVSNSHMRIIVADVASPTSSNFQVTFMGGGFDGPTPFAAVGDRTARRFQVAAASEVTLAKVPQSAVSDGSTGTNTWTDVNATGLYTSRFYSVSVSYGGGAYTNTEEWAMHVQSRAAGTRYLVCVPVDYGSSSANNVNDQLGQQLARGLHADESLAAADRIEFYDSNKAWKILHLRTNVNGTVYWYDSDISGPADVQMTPGMGFWVVRGSGAAYRGNTVFGGKSWLESSVSAIDITTDNGNWNFFGWPLPRPRWHYNLGAGTPADQLGFESLASGGVSNGPTVAAGYKGDEIWEWRNGEWYRSYWLMEHINDSRNGRWWDRFSNDFANFGFEVGRAYYYKHVTNNWGGANFQIVPDAP
ncbi:MAG: fibronectin type III domain-containing protein [Lentisphaerae bacterium]|nr:fibronectin type III domain-containing protein [Lentisphaerota bacterium]